MQEVLNEVNIGLLESSLAEIQNKQNELVERRISAEISRRDAELARLEAEREKTEEIRKQSCLIAETNSLLQKIHSTTVSNDNRMTETARILPAIYETLTACNETNRTLIQFLIHEYKNRGEPETVEMLQKLLVKIISNKSSINTLNVNKDANFSIDS